MTESCSTSAHAVSLGSKGSPRVTGDTTGPWLMGPKSWRNTRMNKVKWRTWVWICKWVDLFDAIIGIVTFTAITPFFGFKIRAWETLHRLRKSALVKKWLAMNKQCEETSPTGERCAMSNGHAGPHVVVNPYHPTERWVTPCTGRPCSFHANFHSGKCSVEGCLHHTGKERRFLECIYCGNTKEIPKCTHPDHCDTETCENRAVACDKDWVCCFGEG